MVFNIWEDDVDGPGSIAGCEGFDLAGEVDLFGGVFTYWFSGTGEAVCGVAGEKWLVSWVVVLESAG